MVVAVPRLGEVRDLPDQLSLPLCLLRGAEVRAKCERRFGVGVLSPARDQFVQSLHEGQSCRRSVLAKLGGFVRDRETRGGGASDIARHGPPSRWPTSGP